MAAKGAENVNPTVLNIRIPVMNAPDKIIPKAVAPGFLLIIFPG
jgi:hypothetical protein